MQPAMVKQTVEKVRLQELALEDIFKKRKVLAINNPSTSQQLGGSTRATAIGMNQGNPKVHTNLNAVRNPTMEQRR